MRHFDDHPKSSIFRGTDIDRDAIEWCKQFLPHTAEWDTNDDVPPTRYENGQFDLIFCVSLFSHLKEQQQFLWLRELRRISRSNGFLIFTLNGSYSQRSLRPDDTDVVKTKGFLFKKGYTGKRKLDGLPDTYQTAFHSKDYIYGEWVKYFKIVRYIEQGMNAYQDAVVLRNEKK